MPCRTAGTAGRPDLRSAGGIGGPTNTPGRTTTGMILWIVVAVAAVTVVVAALIGLGGLGEFAREREFHRLECGRVGPFPEREMMELRYGQAAHCPDCGIQLTRRRANRLT